jgi:hypothetical protein
VSTQLGVSVNMRNHFFILYCVVTPLCIFAEFDLDIVILDDRNYNETKFEETIAKFNPIAIENGTEVRLFFSPARLKRTGFINPVICVGSECFSELNISQPTPTPTSSSTSDTMIIVAMVSGCSVVFLGASCYYLVRRNKKVVLESKFVIRETIDWPPHRIQMLKTGSKYMRGFRQPAVPTHDEHITRRF